MANKTIGEMDLPKSIAYKFAARNVLTAKDALSLTEFELMELLDVGLAEVESAVSHISEISCPPCQTALQLMEDRRGNRHLPTGLRGLDEALCGGIPFGAVTELVGPSGIGKTQLCLKLSLLAALPTSHGGINGRVIYMDIESKFSSRRMIEIGAESFPEIFHMAGMARQMAGRILVLRPTSLSEFTERDLDEDVKASRQHPLAWHISFIKSLAEFSQIPVVVTNQVRSQNCSDSVQYSFQVLDKHEILDDHERLESRLVAALGIHWAHAVTTRLVLESNSGQRFIKVAKSPISPPLAFPFAVTSSGISLLIDIGVEVKGLEINTIHCQGL